ncbi:MAG TPA: hypothetical protein DIT64_00180 [Verrucomicrobiales bacterium]|nr:hypothetical protein [Verrucomicrobiales bacterium]
MRAFEGLEGLNLQDFGRSDGLVKIHQILRGPGEMMHNILCPAKMFLIPQWRVRRCTTQLQAFHANYIFSASKWRG